MSWPLSGIVVLAAIAFTTTGLVIGMYLMDRHE